MQNHANDDTHASQRERGGGEKESHPQRVAGRSKCGEEQEDCTSNQEDNTTGDQLFRDEAARPIEPLPLPRLACLYHAETLIIPVRVKPFLWEN